MADINSDFAQRVVVHSAQIPWIASPIVGVDRRMLDRIGDTCLISTPSLPATASSASTRSGPYDGASTIPNYHVHARSRWP
jgi:hypothetical protein